MSSGFSFKRTRINDYCFFVRLYQSWRRTREETYTSIKSESKERYDLNDARGLNQTINELNAFTIHRNVIKLFVEWFQRVPKRWFTVFIYFSDVWDRKIERVKKYCGVEIINGDIAQMTAVRNRFVLTMICTRSRQLKIIRNSVLKKIIRTEETCSAGRFQRRASDWFCVPTVFFPVADVGDSRDLQYNALDRGTFVGLVCADGFFSVLDRTCEIGAPFGHRSRE